MAVQILITLHCKRFRPPHWCIKFFYNPHMKKMIFAILIISSSVQASECKLTGILLSDEKIETSFVTSTLDECRTLAAKTGTNNFFGLVEKENKLIKTKVSFRQDEGSLKDAVSFEEEESYSNDG